ncbi:MULTISPECIES: hypothetical protein [unclassified Paenibacillus]|uniref:hypothetical protein n=1 Tax=unclassified Paenibacillus TaxID=185978 RepID=UPI001AE61A84|nr:MULTISPECIES: hypothetical protein [unclassified Paenibacillus]MBP1154240.1 hypothetical protein [Paenibacillus sp. PvP091]MBP1170375.1 hypothetical protein [Paenibacillus sp. PvR098]MBP2441403.1 hypothetical protein [Paenibacillus sp. PvP052]
MDALYKKLISESEDELKKLIAENEEWKKKLTDVREHDAISSVFEGEISSLIMMSHLENTKQVYRITEELRQEEEQQERIIVDKNLKKQRFKQLLLETIQTARSKMSES